MLEPFPLLLFKSKLPKKIGSLGYSLEATTLFTRVLYKAIILVFRL